jgi:hypothetical protein
MKNNIEELQKIADYFAEAKLHDMEQAIIAAVRNMRSQQEQLDYYRELIVWANYDDEVPTYHQGSKGEHEINEPVSAELLTKMTKAFDVYKRERDRFRHSNPEITGAYYLAGGYGDKDGNMLPEFVEIVPAYGCAWSQVYEKTDRTISYEGS